MEVGSGVMVWVRFKPFLGRLQGVSSPQTKTGKGSDALPVPRGLPYDEGQAQPGAEVQVLNSRKFPTVMGSPKGIMFHLDVHDVWGLGLATRRTAPVEADVKSNLASKALQGLRRGGEGAVQRASVY